MIIAALLQPGNKFTVATLARKRNGKTSVPIRLSMFLSAVYFLIEA